MPIIWDMEEAFVSHLVRLELKEAWTLLRRDIELRHIVAFTAASLGMTSLVYLFSSSLTSKRERRRLAKLREKKRKDREEALAKFRQKLSESTMTGEGSEEIVSLSLSELQAQLSSGQIRPSQVLHAYQLKALKAHELTNCLVEPITEAEEYASRLDFDEDKDKLLYGLPLSVKDCFTKKGYDCTIGCSQFIDQPFDEDAVILQVLMEQGAIPFVKTNVPQTMLSLETVNPIYGRTCTPHDTGRSAGGSSGGEAALIGARGSILGIGSDIGGSVRCPAFSCGICALKPTSLRISGKGKHAIIKGQRNVPGCNGPMSSSVDGLILLMKALTGSTRMYQLDPTLPIQLFNNDVLSDKRQLTIGYYDYNGEVEAVPAVVRGVHETKSLLESMGHKVVPWRYVEEVSPELRMLFVKSLFADGGKEVRELLKYDELDDSMILTYKAVANPIPLRRFIYRVCKFFGSPLARIIEPFLGYRDGTDAWNHYAAIKKLQQAVIDDWNRNNLDAVISPVFGTVALPHGYFKILTAPNGYLSLYNILDFPAGTLPVSVVTEEDESAVSGYPYNVPDSKVYKAIREASKGTQGLPINIQVATLPFREELCLRIMKELESAVASQKTKSHTST